MHHGGDNEIEHDINERNISNMKDKWVTTRIYE